jgi:hypothetical protein
MYKSLMYARKFLCSSFPLPRPNLSRNYAPFSPTSMSSLPLDEKTPCLRFRMILTKLVCLLASHYGQTLPRPFPHFLTHRYRLRRPRPCLLHHQVLFRLNLPQPCLPRALHPIHLYVIALQLWVYKMLAHWSPVPLLYLQAIPTISPSRAPTQHFCQSGEHLCDKLHSQCSPHPAGYFDVYGKYPFLNGSSGDLPKIDFIPTCRVRMRCGVRM